MENASIKEKIFYWGGLTLLTSVILGGSYYIYKSIFGSDENENKNIDEDNDNETIPNSFKLNNNNIQNINNIDINNENENNNIENKNNENNINDENNINNENKIDLSSPNKIISSIFPTKFSNLIETQSKTPISKKQNNLNNIDSINKKDDEENNNIIKNNNNNPKNSFNIFKNNSIFLKSFGLNIDESKLYNNNNRLTEEGTVRLIMYINCLAQKFYLIDNPTLDEKRRSLLIINNNENDNENNNINNSNQLNIPNENNINNNLNSHQKHEEYLSLCNQTLDYKQKAYQMASDKILKNLHNQINFQEVEEFLKNIVAKQIETLSIKIMTELNNELFKYDLDFMDINKTKEAYIFYLKIYIEHAKQLFEEQEKMKNIENENEGIEIDEENNNICVVQFMVLKMQMDDTLYLKYHIVEEHLKLLVNKYNLFVDNEISQLQNEFDEFNKKIDNVK